MKWAWIYLCGTCPTNVFRRAQTKMIIFMRILSACSKSDKS